MNIGPLEYVVIGVPDQQQNPQVMQVMPAQGQPAAPAAPDSADTLAQLKLLGELHDKGVLTDEEFTREKNRLLGQEL